MKSESERSDPGRGRPVKKKLQNTKSRLNHGFSGSSGPPVQPGFFGFFRLNATNGFPVAPARCLIRFPVRPVGPAGPVRFS